MSGAKHLQEAEPAPGTETQDATQAVKDALSTILIDRLEDVPYLEDSLRLARIHRPLSLFVGVRPEDIVIRGAVLYSLQHAGVGLDADARNAALWWLPDTPRETALRNLKDGGWIEYTDDGWVFTQLGHDLYQLVELLFQLDKKKDMSFGSVILRALKELSGDRYYAIRGLVTQVQTMERSLEKARASHSSVLMEGEIDRCNQARRIVQEVLREVQPLMEDPKASSAIQDLHAANARMLSALSRLSDALAEVTRQHVVLPHGYTPHQITMSLMSMPVEALAAVGERALRPIHSRRALLREDLICLAAGNYLDKERPSKPQRPAPTQTAKHNPDYRPPTDPRVEAFFDELQTLEGDEVPVAAILRGDPDEILMRFANLPFLNERDKDEATARFSKIPWHYEHRPGHEENPAGALRIAPRSVLRRKKHGQ